MCVCVCVCVCVCTYIYDALGRNLARLCWVRQAYIIMIGGYIYISI